MGRNSTHSGVLVLHKHLLIVSRLLTHFVLCSRTIMGARGANIQKVCSDFNVQIKIPDRKSNKNNQQQNGDSDHNGGDEQNDHDIIRISGRTENCEDAAEAL